MENKKYLIIPAPQPAPQPIHPCRRRPTRCFFKAKRKSSGLESALMIVEDGKPVAIEARKTDMRKYGFTVDVPSGYLT